MIQIRKGTEQDLSQTLQLIQELATYEKAPDEVAVTIEEMRNWGFGEVPVFGFFVAEENEKILGIALYYFKYSTWKGKCLFLEDIIVTESRRKEGIGKKLFEEIIKLGAKEKVRRLEWQVLDWNEPAIQFYKKFNSYFDSEWVNCKLTDEELQAYFQD